MFLNICGDLKVVALLLRMQMGYTKNIYFLCLWDSCDNKANYETKEWPPRSELFVGKHNLQHQPLIDPQNSKSQTGINEEFCKGFESRRPFQYFKEKFGAILIDAKLKAGVLIGSQIRKVVQDSNFRQTLKELELQAWNVFVSFI